MSSLEDSVRALASALETLETRISTQLSRVGDSDAEATDESQNIRERETAFLQALRSQITEASQSARSISSELDEIIKEAKSLLPDNNTSP